MDLMTLSGVLCTVCLALVCSTLPVTASEKLPETWVKPPPTENSDEWKPEKKAFVPSERSPLVSMGADGKLVYKPYTDRGDRILDFSQCGYKRSEEPIPTVPVAETLSPPEGDASPVDKMAIPVGPDSFKTIQDALDRVAAMEPDANGFRGTVLLKKGTWYLSTGIQINSGVVLRGEGDGEDGTVLIITVPKDAGTGGVGIQMSGGGSSQSTKILLTGTVIKSKNSKGNDTWQLKLDDGSIFPMRTPKGAAGFKLDTYEGKKVILTFGGNVLTQGGARKVTMSKIFPVAVKKFNEGDKVPALDPDPELPGLQKPGGNGAAPVATSNFSTAIADSYVPSGSTTVTVKDASGLKVGDYVSVN